MPNYFQLQVSGFVTFSVSYHFKSHIFEFLCWKFTFHWHLINSTIIQLRRKYLQAKKREQNPLLVAAIISSKYLCLFSSTLKPSKYFEFAVHTAVLSIYEWLSAAKETTLLWCLLWSSFAFISAFSTGHMLTQPFKVLGRKDVSWILQNFSSVAEKSSLTFLFLHELSFNSLSVWFFWPKSGNFTKICCWYKSTFVITGHHHYLPTELWAQFFSSLWHL